MPICRVCKMKIDKTNDDWVMPSKNWYYHKKCYAEWKSTNFDDDSRYIDMIYDFIARDLKVSYNWHICEAQRKKFIKDNKMTNKGILFALKYFYEIKHGDWEKGHGGIGIIPFIYNDSCAYWAAKERRTRGTIAKIEKQMLKTSTRPKESIVKKEDKPKKTIINFNVLNDLEDED